MAKGRKAERKVYSFRDGYRFDNKKAQVVGEHLDALQRSSGRRGVTPALVVDDARDEGSPLHEFFQWDNRVAADEYRVVQARRLLAAITYTVDDLGVETGKPVRLFLNLRPEKGTNEEQQYVPTVTILSDVDLRARLLRQALAEYETIKRKYEHLVELAKVHEAIAEAREEHGKSRSPKKVAA